MAITDVRMEEDDVVKDPLVPLLGSTFDQNPLCRLGRVSATRNAENNLVWIVTLSYSSDIPKPEEIEDDNPLNAPVKRSISYREIQVPVYRDIDGNIPKLTNGMPYNPPVMVRRSVLVLHFTKNYPTFDIATYTAYHDHVNSAAFATLSSGTVYCQITAEEQWRKGYNYFTVSFEFLYDPRGWQPRPVQESLYSIDSGGDVSQSVDGNGKYVTHPWPLKANGTQVDANDLPTTPPIFVEVEAVPSADFNDLGLPTGV